MVDQPQRPRGRPRKPAAEKATRLGQVVLRLPDDDYAFLSYLVREKRRLGHTENDAARHILIREIGKLRRRYPRRED